MKRAAQLHPARLGFTLLEIILALSIIMGITVAVMAFYQQAGQIRQETLNQVETLNAARMFMARLTTELRSATRSRYLALGLEGGADHVTFLTTVLPGAGVWVEPDEHQANGKPASDLRLLEYRLRYVGQEKPIAAGLDRIEQKLLTAIQKDEKSPRILQELTSKIRFLNFRYWDGAAWRTEWSGNDLPTGVEVTLGAEPLPENTEAAAYPYPTYKRVIYVPAGHWWGGVQAEGTQ